MQEDNGSTASFCLSFNSYSSDNLADTAARVAREPLAVSNDLPPHENEDDDFEFVTLSMDPDASSSNVGFFLDGQIRQVFPLFDRQLLFNGEEDRDHRDHEDNDLAVIGTPLRNLFLEDKEAPSSSSSSEADELEGVPPGSYCVWTPPKSVSPPPGACKKSKSTGSSSRRWRLRDFLKRSHSDGKESLMLLTPNSIKAKKREDNKEKSGDTEGRGKEKEKEKEKEKLVSAHEAFYVRNKAMKGGGKRRSYLPYRQDLVGFFASVNGLGRTFPPF